MDRNIYFADTEGQRSVSPHLETCTLHMLHFQGQLVRVDPCMPVCCSLLRIHRHLQTVSRRSAVGPPVERERVAAGDDSLHKKQLVKQCCWAWQECLQKAFLSTSQSDNWRLYSTKQYVLWFKKKSLQTCPVESVFSPRRTTTQAGLWSSKTGFPCPQKTHVWNSHFCLIYHF